MLNKIEDFPKKNPDQIIFDRLEQYYKKRKAVEHSFSEDLIEIIRNDYILDMLDNNKEDLEKISQTVKDKLVTFFIDFFIDRYYNYKEFIEVSEK